MIAWVIYDISKNRSRRRIIKRCKFFGLRRVQKSVFFGKLKTKHFNELKTDLDALVNPKSDSIFMLPTTAEAVGRAHESGLRVGLKKMLDEAGWVMVESKLKPK